MESPPRMDSPADVGSGNHDKTQDAERRTTSNSAIPPRIIRSNGARAGSSITDPQDVGLPVVIQFTELLHADSALPLTPAPASTQIAVDTVQGYESHAYPAPPNVDREDLRAIGDEILDLRLVPLPTSELAGYPSTSRHPRECHRTSRANQSVRSVGPRNRIETTNLRPSD